ALKALWNVGALGLAAGLAGAVYAAAGGAAHPGALEARLLPPAGPGVTGHFFANTGTPGGGGWAHRPALVRAGWGGEPLRAGAQLRGHGPDRLRHGRGGRGGGAAGGGGLLHPAGDGLVLVQAVHGQDRGGPAAERRAAADQRAAGRGQRAALAAGRGAGGAEQDRAVAQRVVGPGARAGGDPGVGAAAGAERAGGGGGAGRAGRRGAAGGGCGRAAR